MILGWPTFMLNDTILTLQVCRYQVSHVESAPIPCGIRSLSTDIPKLRAPPREGSMA